MNPSAPDVTSTVKFHISLNVSNLDRAIQFYRLLFGFEPSKRRVDYAKFELEEPPLVLSLIPGRPGVRGNLNHLGLRMKASDELVDIQRRLEAGGIRTKREEGVECCYARQTKFWVTDPDDTLWEIYNLHEDIDEHGHDHIPPSGEVSSAPGEPFSQKISWEHDIGDPLPDRIPHEENSVHEVYLRGAANLKMEPTRFNALLIEILRVLRPGGELRVHGLTADAPLATALPPLPGPASAVEKVPAHFQSIQAVVQAGFVSVYFEKLSQTAHFAIEGVSLRESVIIGRKAGHRPAKQNHRVIYLGPLAEIKDDFGNIYRRGESTPLNIHDYQILSKSTGANQFLFC